MTEKMIDKERDRTDNPKTARIHSDGFITWTTDENGDLLVQGTDRRRVFFQTKAKGYTKIIGSSK